MALVEPGFAKSAKRRPKRRGYGDCFATPRRSDYQPHTGMRPLEQRGIGSAPSTQRFRLIRLADFKAPACPAVAAEQSLTGERIMTEHKSSRSLVAHSSPYRSWRRGRVVTVSIRRSIGLARSPTSVHGIVHTSEALAAGMGGKWYEKRQNVISGPHLELIRALHNKARRRRATRRRAVRCEYRSSNALAQVNK